MSRAAALQPARPLTLDSFATAFHARRAQVLAEMLQAAEAGSDAELEERVTQLLEGFAAEITRAEITGPSGVFLKELDEALRRVTRLNGNLAAWHEVISALRRHVLPCLNTAEAAARAEDMWQQARVMLANMMERAQAHQQLQAEQVAGKLHEVSQELITTLDVEQLMQILAARLPELGIPSCYLALYESPQPYKYPQPAPEWSRLILACTEQGRLRLRPEDQRFPSRQLAPGALLSRDRSYALILKPLYFHDHQLGYILFEAGKCEEAVYDRLRRGISSALYAGLLTQQAWHHALQLQTAAEVSRAATSTLDLNQLLPQSVNLIRELFNAQYVGLFLLDAAGRFAVLRAGTGEAGQQMLEAGHKLEVGGPSMIGWCLAHGQARLARDVQQETVHAANPFLPATRSEIALPLITRGRAIGAMTIQAEQPAAFSEEDVAVLQTMAGQLANTIQNAQLHAAEKARAKELAQAYQALQENQRKLLVAEKMASVGRLTAGIAHEMNTPLAAARSALVELDNLIREYRDSMGDAEITVADHQAIAGEMEKIAGVAANALERVMEFVQGVKSQTRDLAAPEHVTFDAVATIEETLLLLSYAALKRQCRVQFERAQPAIEMVGAPAKLSQLVTNLVMNAIEANTKQGGLVRLALRQEAETIVLQVSDQGQGIAPEHLTKIFDPMFTTKPFGEGAGLGLTIAHDIVVGNFGGTLQVASEVGRGTTFTALFPGRRPL